jgi:hypothetical protein
MTWELGIKAVLQYWVIIASQGRRLRLQEDNRVAFPYLLWGCFVEAGCISPSSSPYTYQLVEAAAESLAICELESLAALRIAATRVP